MKWRQTDNSQLHSKQEMMHNETDTFASKFKMFPSSSSSVNNQRNFLQDSLSESLRKLRIKICGNFKKAVESTSIINQRVPLKGSKELRKRHENEPEQANPSRDCLNFLHAAWKHAG